MNIINALLTPNKWSRPQKSLNQIRAIVIHWVANPMSTAMENRNYFEKRKYGKEDYGSAHEIIDLNGDIVVCIPSNELAYNCGSPTYTNRCLNELGNSPNYCTYSIECTHIDDTGKMTQETYNSLVQRCIDLCRKYNLNPMTALWTHQEVVGWKDCHRWFVNNPNEWTEFKQKVSIGMNPVPQIPQWQYDACEWLKQNGFINSSHLPTEVINFSTFAYIVNNKLHKFPSIDPIAYLLQNKWMKQNHDKREPITIGLLGYLLANHFGDTVTTSPIDYLLRKGFLNQPRNGQELLTFGLLGAILKNGYIKGIIL